MGLLTNLQKAIKANDFFHSVQFLRYNQENQYRTITGGLISLAIIIVIIVGFATMIIDTLNLTSISYTYKIEKQTDPIETTIVTDPNKNFMFGIQITNKYFYKFNLSSQVRYFDIFAAHTRLADGVPQSFELINLQACTMEHWKNMPSVLEKYKKLQVQKWLCPKIGQNISLQGKYVSSKGSILSISARPCNNFTDPTRPCASPEQIQQFFTLNQQSFMFRFYYTNTMINPDQQKYLSNFREDMAYTTFSSKIGVQSYLTFSDYVISTDTSIWPFSKINKDVGFFTDSMPKMFPYFRFDNQLQYFTFFVAKSDISYTYERQVQKISSVFSFIGGLIGAIVASLFIINSFTSYSYQISLASKVFQKRKKQQQPGINSKQISLQPANILQFIKYNFYNLCKFMKCNFVSQNMDAVREHRNEILNQLDVKLIIKRLIFLEFCIKHIFEDYELSQLKHAVPYRPTQIKKIREEIQVENNQNQEEGQDNKSSGSRQNSMKIKKQKPNQFHSSLSVNQMIGSQSIVQSQVKDIHRGVLEVEEVKLDRESPFNSVLRIVRKQQLKSNGSDNLAKLETSSKNGSMISKRILQTVQLRRLSQYRRTRMQTEFLNLRQAAQGQPKTLHFQIPVSPINSSRRNSS